MAANSIANIAGLAKITPGLDQREGRKQGGFAIRGVGHWQFVLSHNGRDGQFLGNDASAALPQFREFATTDSFTTQSVRATWIPFADYSLQLALYGNNLTDEDYIAFGTATYSGFGTNAVTRGKPAHYGLVAHLRVALRSTRTHHSLLGFP